MNNKMTSCKVCGEEIAKSAKACPHCGAKNKKSLLKKWWFWVIVIVATIFIISSFGSETEENTNDSLLSNDDSEVLGTEKSETMTASDIYVWIAANDGFGYTVPEKAKSFIDNCPQFFPGSDENKGAISDYIDYEADYPHVTKNPEKYADKLMFVSGNIIDCEEVETDAGIVTYLHIDDYSGYSYCMYYIGEIEDAFEGNTAMVNMLPFGTITFENMGGYYTEAIIGAACYVVVNY